MVIQQTAKHRDTASNFHAGCYTGHVPCVCDALELELLYTPETNSRTRSMGSPAQRDCVQVVSHNDNRPILFGAFCAVLTWWHSRLTLCKFWISDMVVMWRACVLWVWNRYIFGTAVVFSIVPVRRSILGSSLEHFLKRQPHIS